MKSVWELEGERSLGGKALREEKNGLCWRNYKNSAELERSKLRQGWSSS